MADFDPNGFITIAESLHHAGKSMTGNNQDAAFRAAAGRYYYACFLSIYKRCGLGGDDFDDHRHRDVIKKLVKSNKSEERNIGNSLAALHDIRRDADYYVDRVVDDNKIRMAAERTKKLISSLPKLRPERVVSKK
tara:strand:+ start:1801 stop:2205 length:405 start_codon:yes stop_codon:yes gene_type:complete